MTRLHYRSIIEVACVCVFREMIGLELFVGTSLYQILLTKIHLYELQKIEEEDTALKRIAANRNTRTNIPHCHSEISFDIDDGITNETVNKLGELCSPGLIAFSVAKYMSIAVIGGIVLNYSLENFFVSSSIPLKLSK